MKQLGKAVLVAGLLQLGVSAVVAAEPSASGLAGLLDLLQKKGVVTADERTAFARPDNAAGVNLQVIVDLLRTKGAITGEEAATLMQQLSVTAGKKPITPAGSNAVSPAGTVATPPVDLKAQPPAEELKPALEVLREQGVLGVDETAQIIERIGKKWSAADEDDQIAASDQEIEFSRTTLPREGLLADIHSLLAIGLITSEEEERIKKRFQQKLSLERVTADIGEEAKREIKSQVESRVPNLPEWTQRIKFSGDLRLRYQGEFFDSGNTIEMFKSDKPLELLNVTTDRQMMRIRARFGLTAKVNDETEVGMSFATGNTTNPVSTNQTLGDSLNKKSILLDTAYLKWMPSPNTTLWGGRFANPWFCTDLIWDADINFDGVAVSYRPQLTPQTTLFMTAGAFPIQEVELSSRDKWLLGGQLGLQYQKNEHVSARLAAAFYDFENTVGRQNSFYGDTANDYTAPLNLQKGNTYVDIGFLLNPNNNTKDLSKKKNALAAAYRELSFTGALDLGYWNPVHVVLAAEYVNNIGYIKEDVEALTGQAQTKETQGYQIGVTVGHPDTRAFGLWKAYLFYKHLEADAVMDAFTDSDFHLGGTNAKGWITGLDYGVGKNVWLSSRWLTANEISGPPLGIDVFQFNVNARF